MTGADVPPLAQEAMAAAEAAWYEANGIKMGRCAGEWQAGAHAGWQAGWAAALEWAAQEADRLGVRYLYIEPVVRGSGYMPGCSVKPFGDRLRQGGEGGTDA